jgi:hypothetical protein
MTLAKAFTNLFSAQPLDQESAQRKNIHREWDRQRAQASTPAERDEIDAIFSRAL